VRRTGNRCAAQASTHAVLPANALIASVLTTITLLAVGWAVVPRAAGDPARVGASGAPPAPSPMADPPTTDPPTTDPLASDPLTSEPQTSEPLTSGVTADPAPPSGGPATPARAPASCSGVPTDTARTVLQRLPAAAEPCLRSLASITATSIHVVNGRADGAPVIVYWIGFDGTRTTYGTVTRGTDLVLQTFITHPWVITTTDGRALFVVLPGTMPSTVTVT
jgi:VHL beta domain